MRVLLVMRKRPEKFRYDVVPWRVTNVTRDGAAMALARPPKRQTRVSRISAEYQGSKVFNWPFIPDFVATVTTAVAKLFGHHS